VLVSSRCSSLGGFENIAPIFTSYVSYLLPNVVLSFVVLPLTALEFFLVLVPVVNRYKILVRWLKGPCLEYDLLKQLLPKMKASTLGIVLNLQFFRLFPLFLVSPSLDGPLVL
jgi:hypothetical protein